MKALFLSLALLNVVYFLWQFHAGNVNLPTAQKHYSEQILTVNEFSRAQRGAEIARALDQSIAAWQQADVERILADLRPIKWRLKAQRPVAKAVKIAEPPQQDNVDQAKSPPAPVAPVLRKCYEAGPFSEEAEAKKWLLQKGLSSKQVLSRKIVVSSDFQVYFPAAKNSEQTLSNKMMLKDKALQDIWMIPEGDKKGAFSLGVFNEKARALVFKTQLASRGISAEIWLREKTETQWFARVMVDNASVKNYASPAVKLAECSNK